MTVLQCIENFDICEFIVRLWRMFTWNLLVGNRDHLKAALEQGNHKIVLDSQIPTPATDFWHHVSFCSHRQAHIRNSRPELGFSMAKMNGLFKTCCYCILRWTKRLRTWMVLRIHFPWMSGSSEFCSRYGVEKHELYMRVNTAYWHHKTGNLNKIHQTN